MTERRSDRILSIVLSILIHAAIVGALLWGWWQYRQPTATPPSLAIDATVVHDAPPVPATPPPPEPTPPPEAQNPPTPTPEQQAEQQAREERARAEKQAAEEAEQQRQREQAAKEAAEKEAGEKAAAEKAAAEKAAADKAAAEKAAAAKAAADKAEAERKAQQRKAAQERAQREADLRAQLASEEHLNAVQSSPAKAEYLSMITARINRAWIRPPSARAGVKCSLHITQIPGGEVTHVVVAGCNSFLFIELPTA